MTCLLRLTFSILHKLQSNVHVNRVSWYFPELPRFDGESLFRVNMYIEITFPETKNSHLKNWCLEEDPYISQVLWMLVSGRFETYPGIFPFWFELQETGILEKCRMSFTISLRTSLYLIEKHLFSHELYCWWLKSCTSDVKKPVNDGLNYQPQLVRFRRISNEPSTGMMPSFLEGNHHGNWDVSSIVWKVEKKHEKSMAK